MNAKLPKPGSLEAICRGCSCPLLENKIGEGWMEGEKGKVYLLDSKCPLHKTWPEKLGTI